MAALDISSMARSASALIERERLWGMAPHIIWPLRFVLPLSRSPRPAWLVRLGLFLYDHLGGRKRLPGTATITAASLGRDFGSGLHQAEVDYLLDQEWARTAEDVLFRRSRLGLHVPSTAAAELDEYLTQRLGRIEAPGRDDEPKRDGRSGNQMRAG